MPPNQPVDPPPNNPFEGLRRTTNWTHADRGDDVRRRWPGDWFTERAALTGWGIAAVVIVLVVLATWWAARPGFPAEPPVTSWCDNTWHNVIYQTQAGDIAVGGRC